MLTDSLRQFMIANTLLGIENIRIRSPIFADEMTLSSPFPSFLLHFMHEVTRYSKIWCYDYTYFCRIRYGGAAGLPFISILFC